MAMTLEFTPSFLIERPPLPELQPPPILHQKQLPCFGYTVKYSGRQSSQISGGGNTPSPGPPSEGDGVINNSAPPIFAAPPPPPPPPPPASGPLPSVRLNTENAMMTKDKKPFTYTPGGLDLSQIRSPRMQRRITRNANAEGVGEHPQAAVAKTSPLAQPPPQGPLPPSALAAMQPQMAVPVFPTGGVPQLHHVTTPPGSHNAPAPPPPPPPPSGPVFPEPPSIPQPPISNAVPKITPPVIRPVQSPAPPPKVEPSIPTPTVVKSQPMSSPTTIYNEPGSIYVPPVTTRAQVGSLYIPPLTNNTQQESLTSPPLRQQTPQTASPMSPLPTLNKAPTPWMSQHQRQQQQQSVPSWVNREDSQQQQQQPAGTTRIIPIQVEGRNDSVQPPQAHYQAPVSVPQYQPPQPASNQPHTRIIPIQIEGSGTNNAPKQQSPSQQQQQQQRMPVYVHNKFNPSNSPQTPPSPAPYNHSVGNDSQSEQNPRQYQQQQQSWGPTGGNGGQQNWGPPGGNGGPIQSRSFRVLQKITDTDQSEGESDVPAQEYGPPSSGGNQWNNQGIPVQHMRKLQLSEDDRALMNKFRAQVSEETPTNEEENPRYRGGHIPSRVFRMLDESVYILSPSSVDEDSFLHTESDPRYRGAAIPSRAFRMLQNMTDGTGDYSEQVPRGPAVSRGPQTRPVQQSSSVDGATPQPYIPPSEQQVPEPRKYTGGAIPSRSFRMLQAMTAPENCATVSSDGRETPASVSHQGYDENSAGQWAHYDPGYWGPEAWWGCYPPSTPDLSENGEQYWDPFSAMYAYMAEVNAAYGYPPMPYHPMYAAHQYPPPPPPSSRVPRYSHSGNSDSDECSGYSSTDEMAYYGANFARMVPMMGARIPMYSNPPTPATPSIVVTKEDSPSKIKSTLKNSDKEQCSNNDSKLEERVSPKSENISRPPSSIDLDAYETAESEKGSDDDETTSDSDTEVEDEKENGASHESEEMKSSSGGQLQSARSVSDIKVYKNTSGSDVQDSETNDDETDRDESEEEEDDDDDDDDDDEDEDENDRKKYGDDVCIPHQLSVIYEESEQSDAESIRRPGQRGRCPTRTSSSMTTSEDGDSSTTLDNADDESDEDYDVGDSESSTVTVRLPLKLKFSRSENDEEVTTVIVGDSQVKRQDIGENEDDKNVKKDSKQSEEIKDKQIEETRGKMIEEIKDNQIEEIKNKQIEEIKNKQIEEIKEDISKSMSKPEEEMKLVVENETKDDGSADVSVTLCFPSKSNPSKRIEQWRRDTSQFAGSNPTNAEQTAQVTKTNKSTAKTNAKVANDTSQHTATEEGDVYETAESDSDVSVCLSLPLRKPSRKGSISSPPGFESINNISEEDDEEDGKTSSHCEDDSSSTTSIQTVRMASGSLGRSSGSEVESTTIADEVDDVQSSKSNSSLTRNQPGSISEKKKNSNKSNNKHETESDEDNESNVTSKINENHTMIKQENSGERKRDSIPNAAKEEEEDDDDDDDDDEDDDSDESDDSQDGKEPDIIQKIYELCKESNAITQKAIHQQNGDSSKNKELDSSGDTENNKGDGSQENVRRRQNSKSQDESEEDDSGVTSDMSRQISDADTESEAGRSEQSRLIQCQRASTHSRLFKLLQDECEKSDDEDDEDKNCADAQVVTNGNESMQSRREHLTLPLNTNGSDPDSLSSSSGVTSPASPTVTDRLVKELVQSLLQRKKGRRLKKLPLAKLHAAALRILQEDMDPYDTGSSEDSTGNHVYLSPVQRRASKNMHHSNNTNNTANYPMPPQHMMYGTNYYDYCDYYDSWANAASYYGTETCGAFEYDIMPSRAFKLLQEHAQPGGFSSGVINGLWAKCPRIASSKNLPKDMLSATETEADDTDKTESSSSSCPMPPPESAQASARAT
ncbi:hypothetical protein C0J52_08640 [Blattella germanica]|nr:hypothetical protein C0J52_08640 [Blattella germanica]